MLEQKFCSGGEQLRVKEGFTFEGYASVFGREDRGGDRVARGAFSKCLEAFGEKPAGVKMLWQHDPGSPIGVWEELREDDRGLYVKGRLLEDVRAGREAAALLAAGALDGLSIGYKTLKSKRDDAGCRVLLEVDLWEISLVTFPMLKDATVAAKSDDQDLKILQDLAVTFEEARRLLAAV